MRLAVSAGGSAREHAPTCRRCSATSSSHRGPTRRGAATPTASRSATFPRYPHGPRRTRAARRGERRPETSRRSPASRHGPAAAHRATLTLLAEVEHAAGHRPRRARRPGRRARAAALLRQERHAARRRGRPLRGRTTAHRPEAVRARPARVARGAERALGGRARLGAHARGPARAAASLGAARAEDWARATRCFGLHAGMAARRAGLRGASRAAFRDRNEGRAALSPAAAALIPGGARDDASAAFGIHVMHKRRARVAGLALIAAVVRGAERGAGAQAHPLGNFSSTTSPRSAISTDHVDVRYVLDQAEIPTVQERGLGRAEVLRRKLAEVGAAWSSPSTAAASRCITAGPAAAHASRRAPAD